MQTEISLFLGNPPDKSLDSGYSVCTLFKNRNNRPIKVGQGKAVLAAGTEWKVFDFWGHSFKF